MHYIPYILRAIHMMEILASDLHEPPPTVANHPVAVAIAVAVADAEPLYQDDEDRSKTMALMVVMSHQESRWRYKIAGDCVGMKPGDPKCTRAKAASLGAFQQDASAKTLVGDRDSFAEDAYAQARVALHGLRQSFKTCPKAPIAYYAHGRDPKVACVDERSIKISNSRMGQARWLAKQP